MRIQKHSLTSALVIGAAVSLGAPAFAQDPDKGTGRAQGDDLLEDDLLDDDLLDEGKAKQRKTDLPPGVTVPPPEVKREIDAKVAELAARSDAVGDELFEELVRMQNSNAEIERRVVEAKERHKTLSVQVEKLQSQLEGAAQREERRRLLGYGDAVSLQPTGRTPLADYRGRASRGFDPRGYDPSRPLPPDPRGHQQLKWWQQLLITLVQGIMDTLKTLAEARTNSLKAEADALALNTDPKYRPYVNASVRRAVGNSTLGRNAAQRSDPRLNDLNVRRTNTGALANPGNSNTARRQPVATSRSYGTNTASTYDNAAPVKVELLPRVRDPITGHEKPIVNLPLGAAPLTRR